MSSPIKSSEITPPEVYHNRRAFMKAGAIGAAALATGLVYRRLNGLPAVTKEEPALEGFAGAMPTTAPAGEGGSVDPAIARAFRVDEAQTPYQSITHYNNFYEFSTDKDGVAGGGGEVLDGGVEDHGRRAGGEADDV